MPTFSFTTSLLSLYFRNPHFRTSTHPHFLYFPIPEPPITTSLFPAPLTLLLLSLVPLPSLLYPYSSLLLYFLSAHLTCTPISLLTLLAQLPLTLLFLSSLLPLPFSSSSFPTHPHFLTTYPSLNSHFITFHTFLSITYYTSRLISFLHFPTPNHAHFPTTFPILLLA